MVFLFDEILDFGDGVFVLYISQCNGCFVEGKVVVFVVMFKVFDVEVFFVVFFFMNLCEGEYCFGFFQFCFVVKWFFGLGVGIFFVLEKGWFVFIKW